MAEKDLLPCLKKESGVQILLCILILGCRSVLLLMLNYRSRFISLRVVRDFGIDLRLLYR